MNRLSETLIERLAMQFMVNLTDQARQTIIDQLGLHPINHAIFARCLSHNGHHPHYWLTYLALTKNLEVKGGDV